VRDRFATIKVADGSYGNGLGVLKPGSANGNLFDGGRAQAFANGGFPTGIYAGGAPIHKFAEPETGWEAFISGRPGQEFRNLSIWAEAGKRLGAQMGNMTLPVCGLTAAGGGSAGGGSVHNDSRVALTMQAVPEPGVPLVVQAMSAIRRLETREIRKV